MPRKRGGSKSKIRANAKAQAAKHRHEHTPKKRADTDPQLSTVDTYTKREERKEEPESRPLVLKASNKQNNRSADKKNAHNNLEDLTRQITDLKEWIHRSQDAGSQLRTQVSSKKAQLAKLEEIAKLLQPMTASRKSSAPAGVEDTKLHSPNHISTMMGIYNRVGSGGDWKEKEKDQIEANPHRKMLYAHSTFDITRTTNGASLQTIDNDKKPSKPVVSLSIEQQKLVYDAYQAAKKRDFFAILKEKHADFIAQRDLIYTTAREKGITLDSPDFQRQNVVQQVADWFYHNVEPANVYTKNTDIKHYQDVAGIAIKRCKEQWVTPPITLVISAWFHDCERFSKATKCAYLPEGADKYRKMAIHSITSARVCLTILDGSPIRHDEKQRIFDLICQHDKPESDEIVMLDETLLGLPKEDLKWELRMLMDADSLAFFHSTIPIFVDTKAKDYSADWIWNRVRTNIRRLRPVLQRDAQKQMLAMSEELKQKMGFDPAEVAQILEQSGRDSKRELEDKRRRHVLEMQHKVHSPRQPKHTDKL